MDDDPLVLATVAAMLKDLGYTAVGVGSGQEELAMTTSSTTSGGPLDPFTNPSVDLVVVTERNTAP